MLAAGTLAFTATQRMVGALEFMPYLASITPQPAAGDPAGCLNGMHSGATLKTTFLREMRCARLPPQHRAYPPSNDSSDYACKLLKHFTYLFSLILRLHIQVLTWQHMHAGSRRGRWRLWCSRTLRGSSRC